MPGQTHMTVPEEILAKIRADEDVSADLRRVAAERELALRGAKLAEIISAPEMETR